MELLIKAAVIGIAGSLLALLIKRTNPEMSLLLALGLVVILLTAAAELLSGIMGLIDTAASLSGLSPAILAPVLKCVGIGIVTRLAADICKDAGQGSVSSSVELVGTAAALYVSLPLMKTLLQMIGGFL